jgi:hypothetical protein
MWHSSATQAKSEVAGGGKRRAWSFSVLLLANWLLLTRRDGLPQKRFRKSRTGDALTSSQIIQLCAEVQLDSNAGRKSHTV